ncbi:MAG: electron transport complex subunit RsxG [Rhodospirillaceae bacterium]
MSARRRPALIHAVILSSFCTGFGLLLALTHQITAADIRLRAAEDLQNSLTQVIPPGLHDKNPAANIVTIPISEASRQVTVFRATKAGKVTAVAFELRGSGYGGEIRLMLGLDAEGRILGVRTLQHKETPGLGDKIDLIKSDWITRFTGLSLNSPPPDKWKVKKDGGQFDQFSGATITPRGVIGAIRGGLEFFKVHKARLMEAN